MILLTIDLKMVGGKLHAVGAEPILEMLTAFGVFVNVELCRSLLSGLEKVAENVQALGQRQLLRHRGKLRKVRHQIRADTGKVAAGFVRVALYHAYGQITLPHNAVAGAGDLCGQHFIKFMAVWWQGQTKRCLSARKCSRTRPSGNAPAQANVPCVRGLLGGTASG